MKKDFITVGSKISTADGEIVARCCPFGVVYFDEYNYVFSADGDMTGELARVGSRALTLHEVAEIMKENDGNAHRVEWVDADDEEV